MKLHVLGSGSAGNGYILENDTTALVLECGVSIKDFKKAIKFNLRKVAGVLMTHEHGDHAKHYIHYAMAGLDIYTSPGTISQLPYVSHRMKPVEANLPFTIGDWKVIPFTVKHDCAQPYGFLINHPDCGTVLFITDACYCPMTFAGLNQVIVEANYSQEILNRRLATESIHGVVRDRVVQSHMSLATCKELLQANRLNAVRNIVLVHLSDSNSDAAVFKSEIETLTGKKVHIAEKGLVVDFSKTPF